MRVSNIESLSFLYESTGVITRFTDARDPKPLPERYSPFTALKPSKSGCNRATPSEHA